MKPTGATKEFVNAGGRPWKLYTKFSTLREPFQIQDADGSTVAIVTYDPMTMEPEDADDNAALIIRAVNERERLREALEQIRDGLFRYNMGDYETCAKNAARMALNDATTSTSAGEGEEG